jgi:hypothetical protein
MNNKVPQLLKDKQELTRQSTINTVLKAIHELQAQGYAIRIKELMEHTGLSRSTFGKAHVREILVRCGIVEVKAVVEEEMDAKTPVSATKRLRTELKRKDERIIKLNIENAELKQECELLRGRFFLLMQRKNP